MRERLRREVLLREVEERPEWAPELIDGEARFFRVLWGEQPIGWFTAGGGWGFSLWDHRRCPASRAIEADDLEAAKATALEETIERLAGCLDSAASPEVGLP